MEFMKHNRQFKKMNFVTGKHNIKQFRPKTRVVGKLVFLAITPFSVVNFSLTILNIKRILVKITRKKVGHFARLGENRGLAQGNKTMFSIQFNGITLRQSAN